MTSGDMAVGASSASPDGSTLVFEHRGTANFDLWTLPLRGDRSPKPFSQTPYGENAPRFSPDGRWLAYSSNESGRPEVYVQPFPGPGGKSLVSTDGGREPIWSRSGRELFYRSGNKMMAVAVRTESTFTAAAPRMLFEAAGWDADSRAWDVAPGGQRFLFLKRAGDENTAPPQIVVVKNWFEELKRLVPVP